VARTGHLRGRGRLELWVGRTDVAKGRQAPWPLSRGGQADIFTAVPFGTDVRGRTVKAPLIYGNWLIGPSPLGDLGQETRQRADPAGPAGHSDRLAGRAADRGHHGSQVGLDVLTPVQLRQRRQTGIALGEEPAEVRQPGGDRADRLGPASGALAAKVGDKCCAQRLGDTGHPGLKRQHDLGRWHRAVQDRRWNSTCRAVCSADL